MINLYSVGNTNYTTNGDATLTPISATIKKVINGMWQLTMELPYDEEGKYTYLDHGAMLKVVDPSVSEVSNTQLWRVYDYKRNIRSITVIAFPRAMESTFDAPITQLILSSDVTGASAASSLSAVSSKYTVTSNITRTGRSEWSNTNLNRAICGTDSNAFVNVWGGEVVYDNLTIKILDGIGSSENVIDVMYGKNINEISYEVDDSGLTTRIYPLSTDGIRYWDATEEVEYIDSPLIEDYPIVHSNFMETPYQLVIDDDSDISRTAVKTRDIKSRIQTKASTLSHSIWNTAVANGWKIDYMASIADDIIANVQAMVTANIAHEGFVKVVNAAVRAGMAWMKDEEDPEWTWIKIGDDAYKYGNTTSGRYAQNEWQYADKKWRYFGNDYLWQEPADDDHEWAWYEDPDHNYDRKYGTRERYYLAGQYIYYTENGDFKKFWLDGDGWYDADKTDVSDYAWHQDSEVGGAWYFGTEDEDGYRDKYVSGQWVFIEGSLYWFDDNGYYYGEKKDQPPLDWHQSGEAWWFGDLDRAFDEIFVTSQWLKIDRQWYRFNSSGYLDDIHTECLTLFHNGMGGSGADSLTTLVQTCRTECYDLLYDLMEEWSEEQFNNGVDVPTVTINVDMVDLSKTTDYADYQNLETIHLGDTVRCVDYVHHIATIERVVELTYDLLRGYNTSVTIGVANSTVGSMLSGSTGGGTASNNAINVDFIEQSLALKQPTLEAGKNITLTDNLDGTQTIASDKLIRAGRHVEVIHNADGSDTINAEGGALEYWTETNKSISRYIVNPVQDDWTCDGTYLFTRIVQPILGGRTYKKPSTGRTMNGICKRRVNGQWWWGCIFASDDEDLVKYDVWEYGHHSIYAGIEFTKTYGDITMYFTGFFYMFPVEYYAEWDDDDGIPYVGEFVDMTEEELFDDFLSRVGFRVADYLWTGMGIDQAYIFYGGATSAEPQTPSDLPYKVTNGGEVHGKDFKVDGESIYKVKDVQIDEGEGFESVVENKIAQIDLTSYQKSLTEGDNVTLTPQQDGTVEVSATDTNAVADMTDVDIDDQTLADGNVLKWNATSEKWENGTGGGGSANAQEITWANYQALSQAEKENGTIYYIPDAPDSMAMPYLTMENGVPTLVFDDGE